MGVNVKVEWESHHEVDPPAGLNEDAFRDLLSEGDTAAWEYALGQTDSSTAAVTDWALAAPQGG